MVYTGRGYNGTKAEVIDLLNENVDCDLYATLPIETYNALGGKVNNEFLFLKEPDCFIVGQDTPTDYEKCSSFKVHQTNITNAMLAKSIYFPCQVQVNDTIYLIGGYNDNDGVPWSRQVFTYSTINGLISVLPEMIAYQNGHSCTSFNNGSHTLIVSVGGENLGGGDNMIYNPHNVTQIMVVGEHIWELGIILILLFEIHFIFFWN